MSDAAVDYHDPCWFFFTSGTTGRSKAAVLTHGQMAFVVTNHLCDLMPGTTEEDASLVVAPLSHGAGVHQLVQTARAVPTILLASDRFDIDEAYRLIERHRITNLFTVPTILKMMVEHPAADAYDHSSLRYVIYAGAPMYREDQKAALRKLGHVLVQYFGLGEVTGNITVLPPALHALEDGPHARIGTCGFERTGMQVQIQDDEGRELPPLQTGEICVIGPAVFAGYFENPEANAKAFRDGWFRTGDLGHMDEQGFVYITGRASDMYISGGSNIYPREIEEKILTHPAIAEAPFSACRTPPGARPASPSALHGRARRSPRPNLPPSWRLASPATRCRSASSSGMRCRSPVTARSPSAWCATSSRPAACSMQRWRSLDEAGGATRARACRPHSMDGGSRSSRGLRAGARAAICSTPFTSASPPRASRAVC